MPVAILNPINRTDPIPGYGFAVQLGDEIEAWFTECSGLSLQREVKQQPEGGVNDFVHQLPGRIKQTNITLKNGLAGNKLWDWFEKGLYDAKVERRNVTIILYSTDLKQKKYWDLTDAYPIKWTGPTFDSSKSEGSVETLELVHHGIKMHDWTNV